MSFLYPEQANVTVVTTQPTVVATPSFRDYPVTMSLADGTQVSSPKPNYMCIECYHWCCLYYSTRPDWSTGLA